MTLGPTTDPETSSSSSTGGAESSSSTGPRQLLDPDLIAWYRFDGPIDGEAIDSTDNGHNATCDECPATIEGRFSAAIDLDGASQFVVAPNDPEFATETWTLSAWVWTAAAPTPYAMVVGKPVGVGFDNSFELALNILGAETGVVAGWSDGVMYQGLNAPLPALSQWVHVATTVSATEAIMYIDGEVADQEPLEVVSAYDQADVYVGADVDNKMLDSFFLGRIDDVRIYSRALTPQEIAVVITGENL